MKSNFLSVVIPILLILCIIPAIDTKAQEITAKDTVNPKKICSSCYVSDQDDLLDNETENEINNLLSRLQKSTTAEVAVVALNGTDKTSARDLSMELFDLWGVGKKGSDNGLIILLCVESREIFMRTGYGLEGALPDALASQIVNERMAPYFKQGEWGKGLLTGVEIVCGVLYEEYQQNGYAEYENFEWAPLLLVYLNLCVIFFVAAVIFINMKAAKVDPNNKLEKINVVKKSSVVWLCVGILFLPALLLLLIWVYKWKIARIRKHKIVCHCGSEMELLSESQEDSFLDAIKQLEESLGSRDYDVWLCEKCKNTIIYPYDKIFSGYDKCPSCGAKTYKKKYDSVVREPSVHHDGLMKTVFECKNCKYKNEKTKVLPKTPPVIISGGIDGNGGGGNFPGSWGGGFSGGGGGGGRF